jgi:regulation of enolase protein 1 (concanavalin A-like superfamily)
MLTRSERTIYLRNKNDEPLAAVLRRGLIVEWNSEPRDWQAFSDGMRLTTDAGTDFWRHTHYGFVRDNGHFGFEIVEGDFELEVTIAGDYRDQYDQAGLMVRTDDEHWIKCGIEFVDGRELISAVVTNERSDWAVAPRVEAARGNPLRLALERTADAVTISYGPSTHPTMLRIAPFAAGPTEAGIMAASPQGSGFDVTFTDFVVRKRESLR